MTRIAVKWPLYKAYLRDSFLLLFLVVYCGYAYAAPNFPALTDRVVDQANILSVATESKLKDLLSKHEEKTSNQVVIVTLKSLDGYEIADYGYQLGRHWGIGQKDNDNGALLIIAPNERKMRIEVGYGLESTLTDALSSYIINQNISPHFKQQDFDAGVISGTEAIIRTLEQEPSEYSPKPSDKNQTIGNSIFTLIPLFFPIIFLGEIFGSRKRKRGKIFGSLAFSGFFGLLAWAITTSILISIGVFVLVFIMALFGKGGSNGSGQNGGVHFPGGFGSGGGFGGSSGGFGGGGGGFGGGGASGGW